MKNKMKYSVLIMLLFQVCINPLFSQENLKNAQVSIPKNEFGISVGIGSTAGLLSPRNFFEIGRENPDYPYFFIVEYHNRKFEKTPTFNLSYHRNFNHFFTLSIIASYTKMTSIYFDTFDPWNANYYYYNNQYVTLMVGPHFNWFNSKNVRLYSTTSFGLALDFTKSHYWSNSYFKQEPLRSDLYFDFQISPIGIILYNRINVELGFGGTGFFKFGVIF